jgi:hypothetical protein
MYYKQPGNQYESFRFTQKPEDEQNMRDEPNTRKGYPIIGTKCISHSYRIQADFSQ